ncbi:MAG: hypothetical protein ACYTG5_19350, partial [Planctomycetota bacterium]
MTTSSTSGAVLFGPARLAAAVVVIAVCCESAALAAQVISEQKPNRGPSLEQVELARAHYLRVERELLAYPPEGLTLKQRSARSRSIAQLAEYRRLGNFGVDPELLPGCFAPIFVDLDGRRCAVAQLLHVTGNDPLVTEIAVSANGIWVPELEGDTRLHAWLARNGLTFVEATRIQAPSRAGGPPRRRRVRNEPPEEPPAPRPTFAPMPGRAGVDWTPGGATARRPIPSGPATGGPSAPRTAATGKPRTGPSTGSSQPRGIAVTPGPTWRDWWAWEARVHTRDLAEAWRESQSEEMQAGDDSLGKQGSTVAPAASAIRRDLRAAVLAALGNRQTALREAALRSLPVVMESDDVERVVARFEDPVRALRYEAILALGAMAGRSAQASRCLMRLAENEAACVEIGAYARPATRLALAMAQQRTQSESLRRMISASIARFVEADDSRDRVAAFVAAEVGEIDVSKSALSVFEGADEASVDAVYRAALSLDSKDKAVRGPLLRALGGRDRVLRRAATWSLGRDASPMARANLSTAFEFERGLFGRQTALVALAACAEPQSRDLLLEQVQSGRKPLRAWASLGLGLWLRNAGRDPVAHSAILAAYENEHNAANKPAHLLAIGLSRHPEAASILIPRMQDHGASANERAYAAEGLALLGPVTVEIRA